MYPRPHCRFTEVEVPSQLADAAVTVLITLDDLSLELRSERPSCTGLLPLHGLHCEHPFRGDAPDGGCPSNRRRPTPLVILDEGRSCRGGDPMGPEMHRPWPGDRIMFSAPEVAGAACGASQIDSTPPTEP